MRARWLKPDFFTDKKIAAGGAVAALVYQALWCMADDGGTAPCDPDTVKAQLFYRWSAVGVPEISEALRHLAHTSRIVRYQVGDDTYAMISSWETHQKVHKPGAFRYPPASKGVMLEVPDESVPSEAPLPASPPSRHLDSYTARHLDTKTPRLLDTPLSQEAATGKKEKVTWLTPYADAWLERYGGEINYGPAVKAISPLHKKHGEPEVMRRWKIYLAATEGFYANPTRFASTWGEWDGGVPARSAPVRLSKQEIGRQNLADAIARRAAEREARGEEPQ